MATLLQIEANRRNAEKSTGPTSFEGKQIVAQNARSHGVFCNALLVEGEDPEELAEMRAGLLDEIKPRNMSEKIIVERILSAAWRLRRLERAEAVRHAEIADGQREQLCLYGRYPTEDAEEEANWKLKRRSEIQQATAAQLAKRRDWAYAHVCPAGLTLANDLESARIIERFGNYEKRLEATLHRAWRELRQLRKDQSDAAQDTAAMPLVGATPASPSLSSHHDASQEMPATQASPLREAEDHVEPIAVLQNKPNSCASDDDAISWGGAADDADEAAEQTQSLRAGVESEKTTTPDAP